MWVLSVVVGRVGEGDEREREEEGDEEMGSRDHHLGLTSSSVGMRESQEGEGRDGGNGVF